MTALEQSNALSRAQSERRKGLHVKIKEYLDRVGTVGDPEALQLLRNSAEILQAQNLVDDKVAETPNNIGDTLQAIQQSLTRIERNETTPRSYAAAATGQGRDEPAPPKNQNVKPQQARKDKAPTPREARRAREITVHIMEDADKEKMKLMPTKELVETLQMELKE